VLTRKAAARASAKQESAPLKAQIKSIDRAIHEHDKAQALAMGSHVKRYKQWIKRESMREARENMNPVDLAIYKHKSREAYKRKVQSNPEAVRMVWRVNRTKRRNRANNDPLDRLSTAQVREVLTWQGGACAYCGEKHGLHLDHMHPLSRGGLHSQRNIQFLCAHHNMHKHTLTDREYRILYGVPLVTPWDVL
jgi:5-methylcytosine-specific restriction endonuclease McrA